MPNPATSSDLEQLLGDDDELMIERILETRATMDEVAEALADLEDERRFGERREPSSATVAAVREILEDLLDEGEDEYDHAALFGHSM